VLESAKLDEAPFNPFIVLKRGPPPRFGFSPGEKDMLLLALLGGTDAEVAGELSISPETVRKRWRSVFERVAARADASVPPSPTPTI
jgi:DNA-binding CsgD family transcriptional regulator